MAGSLHMNIDFVYISIGARRNASILIFIDILVQSLAMCVSSFASQIFSCFMWFYRNFRQLINSLGIVSKCLWICELHVPFPHQSNTDRKLHPVALDLECLSQNPCCS